MTGRVTQRHARSIATAHPGTTQPLAAWIREAAHASDRRRADRLANLAAPLRAPGLGATLRDILDADIPGPNDEDLVEILGEIRAADAVPCLFRTAERSVRADAPAYRLRQKVVFSLGEIGTAQAHDRLRAMTAPPWPDPVRRHAAVELEVEDELGLGEDRVPGRCAALFPPRGTPDR
ncbi:hypothetical protein [Streptomyces sp. NPDC003077]|uniref:hypothetical protein n=1 Tax=Streptomyces sp. NPDC003077 TaxID=3154443 RepID=UPI0033B49ECC